MRRYLATGDDLGRVRCRGFPSSMSEHTSKRVERSTGLNGASRK